MLTTVGQVLVNDALPPRFRDYGRVMDSNGIEQVLQQIAREAPEEYAAVTKRLMEVGNSAAFDTGTTIRMSDLRPAYDKRPLLQALDIAEEKIRSDKTLTDAQKSEIAAAKNINVSDHDFCEYGGKLICSYSWGDQHGHEFLALAEADCTEKEFCESYFVRQNVH